MKTTTKRIIIAALVTTSVMTAAWARFGVTAEPAKAEPWDSTWPVTAKKVDYQGWEAKSLSSYKGCVGTAMNALDKKSATQLVEVRALSKSCMAIAVAASDAKRVCLAPTKTDCLSMAWLSSWCGRGELVKKSSSATWACYAPLNAAKAAHGATPGVTQGTSRVPERMQAGEVVRRTWLERDSALRSQARPGVISDTYTPPPSASSGPLVAQPSLALAGPPYLGWGFNGGAAATCEEWGYEKYWELNEALRGVAGASAPARAVVDRFFRPAPGQRALITAGNAWDLRDRAGAASPPPPMGGAKDDHVWLTSPVGQPHVHGTFKNAYYYLSRLYDGVPSGYSGRLGITMGYASFDGERSDQRAFYRVDLAWHRQMDAALRQQGWLDEELEYLRGKQDAMLALHDEWLDLDARAACAPIITGLDRFGNPINMAPPCPGPDHQGIIAARDAKWAELQAALAEGYAYGCLGGADATPTPCDWAPSRFADDLHEGHARRTAAAVAECTRVAGAAAFTEAALEAHFPALSRTGAAGTIRVSLPQSEVDRLNGLRSTYLAKTYVQSTASMASFLVDEPHYRRELFSAAGRNLGAIRLRRSFEDARSSTTDHVSASMLARTSSGLRAASQTPPDLVLKACGIGATMNMDESSRFTAHVGFPHAGTTTRLASFESWTRPDPVIPGATDSGGINAGVGLSFGRREVFAPQRATVTSGSLSFQLELGMGVAIPVYSALPAFPFDVHIELQGAASAGLTMSLSHTSTPFSSPRVDAGTCNMLKSESFSFSMTPSIATYLGVGVHAAVGFDAGVGFSIGVGVEGGASPLSLELPVTYSHTKLIVDDPSLPTTANGRDFLRVEDSGQWHAEISGDIGRFYLRLMVYVKLAFFNTTIFDAEIADVLGKHFEAVLLDESQSGADVCFAMEAAHMMGQGDAPGPGCKCAMRNNTLPECQ